MDENWILDLQGEVETLSKWGKSLDASIQEGITVKARLLETEQYLDQILNQGVAGIKQLLPLEHSVIIYFGITKLLLALLKRIPRIMPYFTMKSIKKFWFYLHTNSEKLESILLAKFGTQPRHPIQLLHRTQHLEKISFVKKEKPLVSIIIPAFNQFDYTYSCLLAIHTNTSKINYEVIIADDASDQKTEKYFSLFENVRVFSNSSNQGFILNCNKAAGLQKARIFCCLTMIRWFSQDCRMPCCA